MGAKVYSLTHRKGADEFYLIVTPDGVTDHFTSQRDEVFRLYDNQLDQLFLARDSVIWATFYLSDCMNQEQQLRQCPRFLELIAYAAVSVLEGKPIGSKIAILAYHIRSPLPVEKNAVDMEPFGIPAMGMAFRAGTLEHIVIKNALPAMAGSMAQQANDLFGRTEAFFNHLQLPLQSFVRTWIYIRDIGKYYADMVNERRSFYYRKGLTISTGFPASTGIGGFSKDPNQLLLLDGIIIRGAETGQIRRMQALSHLCSTMDYGVTFERGIEVVYGDRRHFHISGTASISPNGQILHEGDVIRQTARTVENMTALLANHGAALEDMAYLIVYIRDSSDDKHVRNTLSLLLPPHLPYLLVEGHVCRPGWLIEIEGLGISGRGESAFPPY